MSTTTSVPHKFINAALVEDISERMIELLNAVGEPPVVAYAFVAVTEPDLAETDKTARHSFYVGAHQGLATYSDKVAFALGLMKELQKQLKELNLTPEQLLKTGVANNG
jgi:hypothetical protein